MDVRPEGDAALPLAIRRVVAAFEAAGTQIAVRVFPEGTRTAQEAARAIGCELGQIVKSLVFVAGERPVLALAAGTTYVDETKLAGLAGGPVRRARAEEVRDITGFPIGGVPPVGHTRPLPTFVDAELLKFSQVWAAAGTPTSVFPIDPRELVRITGGRVVELGAAAPSPCAGPPPHIPDRAGACVQQRQEGPTRAARRSAALSTRRQPSSGPERP